MRACRRRERTMRSCNRAGITEKASIRGVVLTSAKKTFFAGGNLGSLLQSTPDTRDEVLLALLDDPRDGLVVELLAGDTPVTEAVAALP